jgi:hypothetical protein
MAKSMTDNRKKKRAGRPRVGAILIGVRVPPADIAALDKWIAKQSEPMTRPEALRAMMTMVLEIGLMAKK